MDLGWDTATSIEEVFGVFWAKHTRNTDGTKRSKLCQVKINPSWQLAAMILNSGLDNAKAIPIDPVTGDDLITALQNALAGTNKREIRRLGGLAMAYNESGDNVAIIDLDGTLVGKANPKGAKAIADRTFADCPL